ncbi:MAG: 4-hydroxy-tetrahydrodipicolinate reductase [Bacillota bacterium]|nr:4-hydroxy-tetrahydrodipicolinate reductase [Bacillota bacterium]
MKIIVNGSNGHMGNEVMKFVLEGYRGSELAAAVDINVPQKAEYPTFTSLAEVNVDAECIIDFSHHSITKQLMDFAISKGLFVVIATTGQSEEELALINEASKKIPIFISANMSLGIALLVELAKTTVKTMPDADIEIIEQHHNRKLDAPSGTALLIANAIRTVRENAQYMFGRDGQHKREKNEIGIHAVRMGNIVGIHEVIVGTDTQTITLKHEAHSRTLFAEGAIAAANFLKGKPAGKYDMKSMIND